MSQSQQLRARVAPQSRDLFFVGGHSVSFACAGATVYIQMAALRDRSQRPRFQVYWMPDKPARLSAQDIRLFDQGKAEAIRELMKRHEEAINA